MNRQSASRPRLTLAIVVCALFVLPLYLALVNAFKLNADIKRNPLSLPLPPTLDNITTVLSSSGGAFWQSLALSFTITGASVILGLLAAGMLSYKLARSPGWVSKIVLAFLLLGLMIPQSLILGSLVDVLRTLGIMQSIAGLIAANVGFYMPFAVFLYYGFIRALPKDIEEAAQIDGASFLRIYWQVVFPQLRPVTASVAIFLAVFVWNDFINPLIILGPFGGDTVTVGVYRAIGAYSTDFGQLFGTMFVAAIPVVIAYLFMQRQFVKGLSAGAVK